MGCMCGNLTGIRNPATTFGLTSEGFPPECGNDGLARYSPPGHLRDVRGWLKRLMSVLAVGFTIPWTLPAVAKEGTAPPPDRRAEVVVVPVRAQIADPELFILRRGIKDAIDRGASTLVLDMETPGGALDTTFEILKALEKFPGKTVTYVNGEAISAGALIAAGTEEIHFAPGGVIGAAAPVLATGGEISESMKLKIVSYLRARVRAISEDKGFRGDVLSAMIDQDFELKIGEEVIKPKGELLTLTAQEAMRTFGDPPQPLLGSGISPSLEDLLDTLHGKNAWTMNRLEITWSERVAQYLTAWAPILMAVGLVLIFTEMKTPGFGMFGIGGGILLALVFFGHHAAGLSGHEPALFFLLGVVLVALELFLFPGTFVFAIVGGLLVLGSLVWSMSDLWPDEPLQISSEVFLGPLANVLLGVVLAAAILVALLRFLPKGGPWGKMVLEAAVAGPPATGGRAEAPTLIGKTGIAATDLFPTGQVEIDGRRHDARLQVGTARRGTPVRVTGGGEFELIVEVAS